MSSGNIFQFGPAIGSSSGSPSPTSSSSSSAVAAAAAAAAAHHHHHHSAAAAAMASLPSPYAFSPHYLTGLSSYHGHYSNPASPFLVPTSPVIGRSAFCNTDPHAYAQQAMISAASLAHNQSLRAMAATAASASSSSSSSTTASSSLPPVPPLAVASSSLSSSSSSSSSNSSVSSTRNSPTATSPGHDINNNSRHHKSSNDFPSSTSNHPHNNNSLPFANGHSKNANNHHNDSMSRHHVNNSNNNSDKPYPMCYARGSMIQLADGTIRRVEDMKTEDFISCVKSSNELSVDVSSVLRIERKSGDRAGETAYVTLAVGRRKDPFTVETPLEHPFFVYYKGWSSCSPDRSRERYGLDCRRLEEGDNCISLSRNTIPKH